MLLLSQDSKYLFSTDETIINVYNAKSGDIVYKLSHTDTLDSNLSSKEVVIASICLNPFNKYQLLSFHANSTICLWDYEDGLLLKTFDCKLKINKIININSSIYAVGALKTSSNSDNDSNSFYRLLFDNSISKSNQTLEHELIVSNLSLNLDKSQISIDKNESYIAYIEGRKKIVISHFKYSSYTQKFKSKIELTCLALHPNEDCIATGTTTGKIIVWYNYLRSLLKKSDFDSDENNPKPTECVLHWHSLPVLSVFFTTEGSILLSGGHECVLVKWLFKSGQKDFKPRLGSPINNILASADNSLYITRHLDNTIHLIGANMKVVQTISTFLCPLFQTINKEILKNSNFTLYPTGLNYFNKMSCLVTNGKPGHLQFYSINSDKLLFNLDIVNENYISPENLNRPNVHTEIECLAFNSDSTWLATVERRDDSITTPETSLKFWYYDSTTNKFSLNTLVRHPHSFDQVTKIKFKPNENVLLSCGQDGCFKSWRLTKKFQSTSSNWVYHTSNGYRDMNPNNVEFLTLKNSDFVAVSFNYIVTLWKFEIDNSFSLVDDLMHCHFDEKIKFLQKFSQSNLIVVHEQSLNIWNFEHVVTSTEPLLHDTELKLNSNCVLSEPVDDVLFVKMINESQIVIISRKLVDFDDYQAKIKVSYIEKNKVSIEIKVIHEFELKTNGFLNFVMIPNPESNVADLENLNCFYTDNFGVVKKLKINNLAKNIDLDDSIWQNRKKLSKNLEESNLARIIGHNRLDDIRLGSADNFSSEQKNEFFESSLNKIENTPAFLMPKIGDFCFNVLKSMLVKQNEN
ncbi:WD repeat-containing 75-like [Brachionus plicatilis]|uniref:WD repeat-containing 75-like n=1 Tax=Brachionus plicatilis TaxID=10195 RepID=A0A3M7Q719_BRAPC|nr:WD repeat-containing 75-like [Brachionus plicatilis]